MSPSAYLRGTRPRTSSTRSTTSRTSNGMGIRVVNGSRAFRVRDLEGAPAVAARIARPPVSRARASSTMPSQAAGAARGLRFPVVVKANIGGSGAGIVALRFARGTRKRVPRKPIGISASTRRRSCRNSFPRAAATSRASKCSADEYLYAINVFTLGRLASISARPTSARPPTASNSTAPPARWTRRRTALRVEGYTPAGRVIAAVERILQTAGVDVGGVEYLVDDRDGQLYYYDINALSNFVADAPRVIGFDPFVRLVDYLEQEAR